MFKFGLFGIVLAAVLVMGCGDATSNNGAGNATDTNASSAQSGSMTPVANTVEYCKCGHEKGSADCCAEGLTLCDKCGKAAGSALCCVEIPADLQDVDFCACGWAKGSENCCSKDGKICADCGMHQGSTLCCKINKK